MAQEVARREESAVAVPDALARYQQQAAGAFSTNMERAIRSDTKVFADWCATQGYASLPAEPATIAAFVDDQAAQRAPATVRRYVSSIAHLHRAADVGDPTKSETVRLALKRMARSRGTRQRQARGLTGDLRSRLIDAAPDTLRGKRDAALLSVAYDTLARRSELVAMQVSDVEQVEDGSGAVLIRRSKADQEGRGQLRYLAPDTMDLLRGWLEAAGVTDGALSCGVTKGGRANGSLHPDSVARSFKRMAREAGVKADVVADLSGHSTRVGAAQDLVGAGVDLAQVMRDGGWRSPDMVARYTEKQAVKNGGMARLVAVQNRR